MGRHHIVSRQPEKPRHPPGRVDAVIDDEDAGFSAPWSGPFAMALPSSTVGRRQADDEFAALSRPFAAAAMLPPCISTSFLTSVSPMPRPPSDRAEDCRPA